MEKIVEKNRENMWWACWAIDKQFVNVFWIASIVWFVFVYTEIYWEQQLIAPEKKWHFGFDSGKNVNFKFSNHKKLFVQQIHSKGAPGFLPNL